MGPKQKEVPLSLHIAERLHYSEDLRKESREEEEHSKEKRLIK
jgi:hypothetical protein